MLHRIFLAINLPERIKNKLIEWQKNWPTLPCRWVKKENLHLTLIFLGNLDDQQLIDLSAKAKEVAKRHKPFYLKLKKIVYGPDLKKPRMVWVLTNKPEELFALQKDLEEEIYGMESFAHKLREDREYSPHITLGRLKQWEFRRMEDRPEIDENINYDFEVKSFEIMESFLKRSGAEYEILESIPLLTEI